ncbi:(deoxy)nucleoside triphosphate pyrophosphohydrolase [Sphingobacterium sp. SYP-B4668]|uniref:(deoxy)nucleoside triphosphate pyrophosphohydrolase n=1 Tax=Sphingobacterium sp. SYP-B4668 TaxID=2996035 RepID=UPI0022DDC7EE|nr:(deoxy)nucleoside triphosphate pyrophosphohydrolase [Sphingobacterium sp. SYP-B4668]
MLQVTCAIIEHEGKILICQRSSKMTLPLKWEFPGGKIEPGESKKVCLRREIEEELGIQIYIQEELSPVEHHYPNFSLTLYPFRCELCKGQPVAMEHAQAIWIQKSELDNFDWAEADLPIIKEYQQHR